MKKIKITIYPDGYVNAETLGIKGKKCENYRPVIEKLLQNRIIEDEHTDEYYEQETVDIIENEEVTVNG